MTWVMENFRCNLHQISDVSSNGVDFPFKDLRPLGPLHSCVSRLSVEISVPLLSTCLSHLKIGSDDIEEGHERCAALENNSLRSRCRRISRK